MLTEIEIEPRRGIMMMSIDKLTIKNAVIYCAPPLQDGQSEPSEVLIFRRSLNYGYSINPKKVSEGGPPDLLVRNLWTELVHLAQLLLDHKLHRESMLGLYAYLGLVRER